MFFWTSQKYHFLLLLVLLKHPFFFLKKQVVCSSLFWDTLFWYLFFVVCSKTTYLQIILLFLFDVVPLVFGRLFRFPFSSLSFSLLQLLFSFLFRLFLAFFNLVLSKNHPFLRTKDPCKKYPKTCFLNFSLVEKNYHKLFFHHLFHFQFLIFLNVSETLHLLLLVSKKTS